MAFDGYFWRAKLPLMPRRRATLILLMVAASCGRSDSASQTLRGSSSAVADSAAVAVSGEWPLDLGTALVIPADTENLAVILYPATPSARIDPKSEIVLLGSGGDVVRSNATAATDSAHCGDAPMLGVGRSASATWSVGLSGAKARAVLSDSLEMMSHSDSVLYQTEGSRLASTVSGASARHTGLPFSLVAVRRLRFADTTIVALQLVRRVNQEANPAEERTLVVAERVGSGAFTAVHSDRSEGTEEMAAHFDLIGAFRAGSTLYLMISSDAATGSTIQILERSGGTWRVRWTRSISC
jgi:hypothetical protein